MFGNKAKIKSIVQEYEAKIQNLEEQNKKLLSTAMMTDHSFYKEP